MNSYYNFLLVLGLVSAGICFLFLLLTIDEINISNDCLSENQVKVFGIWILFVMFLVFLAAVPIVFRFLSDTFYSVLRFIANNKLFIAFIVSGGVFIYRKIKRGENNAKSTS